MKKILTLLIAMALAFSLAGCKKEPEKKEEKPVKQEAEVKKEEKTEKKVEEVIPANQNLLTGVPDLTDAAIGKRPVAVMVNNVDAAMPQYGIGKADVIFEMPVEGDVTRFMALYADYTTVPRVCAVRSCRYYFPVFSQGFDAFYVNWGIDDSIGDYLASLGLDQFDGMYDGNGLFARDEERLNSGYDLEHTAYFEGTQFANVVQSQGIRTDLEADKKDAAFQFNGLTEQIKPAGADCTQADINFGAARAKFTYDEANKVYKKELNGNPQIDGNTGEQLAFANVFVLETAISIRDEIGHKDVECLGGKNTVGYYISNGAVQKISWEKSGEGREKARLKFFDEQGKELKINRGKSYIAVNYPSQAEFR